jgi:hypothetical protein
MPYDKRWEEGGSRILRTRLPLQLRSGILTIPEHRDSLLSLGKPLEKKR